jgi:hypothetical protein
MTNFRSFALLSCLFGAALAAGCANKPLAASAAPAPSSTGLMNGIALYNNGDYNGAIRRLGLADVTGGSKTTQLAALKYTAFSYCLTSRQTLCRQQFDKALKLDSSFDLEPGEHGHPLWGPVFVKAKKGK